MAHKIVTYTIRTLLSSVFLILIVNIAIGQEKYHFTPPKTVYNSSFQNIEKNITNQSILKYIILSQPIYLTGSEINMNPIYISNQLKQYDTTYSCVLNYYSRQYISTYTAHPSKIAYATSIFNHYAPTIQEAIHKSKLPNSFRLIPLVCSGFDPLSNNQRGGSGFWHLNYAPAVKYGLIVNEFIDERKDFKKSTQAASAYLNDLYNIYQDWELTLAAYSCGVTTINKALKRTESKTFWEIYHYLPETTRDLVPSLTAMVYCFHEARNDNYLLNEIKLNRDTIHIDKKLYFSALQYVLQIDSSTLILLNPTLNQPIFPKGFNAIFPKNSEENFVALKDSIYYYQDSILLKPKVITPAVVIPKGEEPFIYKVKSGDVLGIIAERFNVGVSQIQDWNNIDGTRIDIGQELTIYGKKSAIEPIEPVETTKKVTETTTTNERKATLKNSNYDTYTVKSGDNLWIIAKSFPGISAQDIMDFNGIDENLKIGQVLKIQKK